MKRTIPLHPEMPSALLTMSTRNQLLLPLLATAARGKMIWHLALGLLLLVQLAGAMSMADAQSSVSELPSLYARIYSDFPLLASCLRYHDAQGATGCQATELRTGPLIAVQNNDQLRTFLDTDDSAKATLVLATSMPMRSTLDLLQEHYERVAGVILPYVNASLATPALKVLGAAEFQRPGDGQSDAEALGRDYRFPVFGVDGADEQTLRALDEALAANMNTPAGMPRYHAESDARMFGSADAETCFRRGAGQPQPFCLPVGGRSVFSSFTPLASYDSAETSVPTVWLTTAVDTRILIGDMAVGAEAAVSGVVAVLAAVDALSQSTILATAGSAQIMIALFNTESFGRAGSRRFIRDIATPFVCKSPLENGACSEPYHASTSFTKINSARVGTVLDVGPIGGASPLSTTFYGFSDGTIRPASLIADLNTATSPRPSGAATISFAPATDDNLPGSCSAQSFVDELPAVQHIHITNNDKLTPSTNPYAQSAWDDGTVHPAADVVERLCGVASALGRAVHALAVTGAPVPADVQANCTLVAELWRCLTRDFGCAEVQRLVTVPEGVTTVGKTPGLFQFDTGTLYTEFLHNFIATRTHLPVATPKACTAESECSENNLCIAGKCVNSFTRFHDAYGTGIEWDYTLERWRVVNADLPAWAQSNYASTILRIFLADNHASQIAPLVVSVVGAAMSVVVVYYGKQFLARKLKVA